MKIEFVEIKNFRKLQSVRIDFSDTTTIFVGSNNSGKTSAMEALSLFLTDHLGFYAHDFTLSNWIRLNEMANSFKIEEPETHQDFFSEFENYLPTLDLWLKVDDHEIHLARHLIPTLDWDGGSLGVRFRLEPKDLLESVKAYKNAVSASENIKNAGQKDSINLAIWPTNFKDFLDKKLKGLFKIRQYLLDAAKLTSPINGVASPQKIPDGSEPLESDPLKGLIRIDTIGAQRGLGTESTNSTENSLVHSGKRKLSNQLRTYFDRHLSPHKNPVPSDIQALDAIQNAEKAFNEQIQIGFKDSLLELQELNYPGISNPTLRLSTKLTQTAGLNHSAAVQYELLAENSATAISALCLPEEYNGLGYQNLISMVFKLMSFRDSWLRVGKDQPEDQSKESNTTCPIHLVLVEEPEAHLHAQVQQVFVRKAYDVLRKHPVLEDTNSPQTQLIISTHSSHIAHEIEFSKLRYFQRNSSNSITKVATSTVLNLSEVFGKGIQTERFVSRYLKSTHCDLFFADAAIFVEGAAERILIPNFIQNHFPNLNKSYLTIIELGGSHAHRFKNLIECLGIPTLVITDLDSASPSGNHEKTQTERGCGLITSNVTLKAWHPKISSIDDLLAQKSESKNAVNKEFPNSKVRICYQFPITVQINESSTPIEFLASTFEHSLIAENTAFFRYLNSNENDTLETVKKKLSKSKKENPTTIIYNIVNNLKKAELALDLLTLSSDSVFSSELKIPEYISEGLIWLQEVIAPQNSIIQDKSKLTNESPLSEAPEK